jgi:hypothetical protein
MPLTAPGKVTATRETQGFPLGTGHEGAWSLRDARRTPPAGPVSFRRAIEG